MHRANSVRHNGDMSAGRQPTSGAPSNKQPNNLAEFEVKKNDKQAEHKRTQPNKPASDNKTTPIYMKSCLSDGDFNEILIQVRDYRESEADSQPQSDSVNKIQKLRSSPTPTSSIDGAGTRRRSSCSSAEKVP